MDENQKDAFWSKVQIGGMSDCWPWLGAQNSHKYGNVRVDKKYLSAHRVAWELANFAIPDGYQVCHVCDNGLCCNPAHLMLGTNQSNFCDMLFKGRGEFKKNKAIGERNVNAKLTAEKVSMIRRLYESGELNQYELAAQYGVTQSAIGCVIRKSTWRHVA